jgi:Flp pilus assembly protein TadG
MAMVLPVLLVIIFGIIDYGRQYNAYIQLNAAAREGARAAVLRQSDATIRARATGSVALNSPALQDADIDIVRCPNPPQSAAATVTINYRFQFITPFPYLVPGISEVQAMQAKVIMPCVG